MVKIDPIINNIKTNVVKNATKAVESIPVKPPYELGAAAIGTCGVIISTFIKDYKKTEDEENFFQFKIDEKTGKHYAPDIFQSASGMNLYLGNDVLVTAPTGTGKTAIAEYVITKNLKEGGKTFYTTPLKALSNEKFLNFSKIYGEENVGLLTGDTKINPHAPIIIMTTEVYRNMSASEIFDSEKPDYKGIPNDLKTVIFDELQYLGDIDRGGIWEQSIMFTPKDVQILSLSATIGNNEEINNWIATVKNRKGLNITPEKGYLPNNNGIKETVLINVPSENRHVPLTFNVEHIAAEIKVPRGGSKSEKIKAKKEGARISQSIYAKPREEGYRALTKKLYDEGKLPAIYFVFSKKESRHLLKFLSTTSEILTTEKEQDEIARIIKRHLDEGVYLGESLNTEALLKGYAVHNAGLLPSQKTLIEELFQKKLVKVVIATETLSAGINMPAKTTVISSPRKPASTSDGGPDHKRNLSANEFHQMAGRAGRRSIDTEGFCYCISCNQEQTQFYKDMMASTSNPLKSNLELDFAFITKYMAENIEDETLKDILKKSFYVYDENGEISEKKLNKIIKNFNAKRDILIKEGFIKQNGGITEKGKLIKLLNGYEQIPIINILADKSLARLNSVQLAGIIGGLANIEYNIKDEFPAKPFELKNNSDFSFARVASCICDEVDDYNYKVQTLYPERVLKVSPKVMDHIYMWADLNSKEENSRKNWKEMVNGIFKFSIKDEGTLYKEITSTSDLIKQLIEVSEEGYRISENEDDAKYYREMAIKLSGALDLIQQEPACENKI